MAQDKLMMMNQSRPPAAANHPGTLHHTTSSTASSAPSVDEDSRVVKLLIYDDSLTEEEVDTYFQQFGELLKATKIQKGKPNLASVQFKDPSHARLARKQSRFSIRGVHDQVAIVPNNPRQSGHTQSPTENLLILKFSCKPLALAVVQKEILKKFAKWQMIQVDVRVNTFIMHVPETIADLVKEQVKSVISSHESKIETKDVSLEFYYLPVLADLDIQRAIHSIKLPSQVRISRGAQKVELGELAAHYENWSKGASELATLNQYLTPSATEGGDKYQWYWCDDVTFQPYTERISDQIEKKFLAYDSVLETTIRRQHYTIDTFKMTQTNKQTNKIRKIERELVKSSDLFIKLHITAHKTIAAKLVREMKDILSKSIEAVTVQVPTTVASSHAFITSLLEIAQNNYVQANFNQRKLMTLLGEKKLAVYMQIEIKAEILKMEGKIVRTSVPDYWETQSDKCELKTVTKGSLEWNEISDKIQKPDFQVSIIKIERIQNIWLWETYLTSKKRISDKNGGVINEKMLLHGSRENKPKEIYGSEQGFDHRLAHPGLYGEGSYFAVDPIYSHQYAYKLSEHYPTGHTSQATGHTSQATGHTSQATGHTSQAAGHTSQATGHTSQATGHTSQATGHTSQATGHTSQATGHTSQATGHTSHTTGHTYQLFLVNVITGISCQCTVPLKMLKVPPKKSEWLSQSQQTTASKFEGERFDSVCGNSYGYEIYVIYELGRAYPAYLITYAI